MKDQTVLPSQGKPWLKYFPPEHVGKPMPQGSIYAYLKENAEEGPDYTSIHYYGFELNCQQLVEQIDRCADAFYGLGVRPGDVVSVCSVAIPETIYSIYALNKLGAVANMIDPRMDVESLRRIVDEAESSVIVIIDQAFTKLWRVLPDLELKHVIVESPSDSLPLLARTALNLNKDIKDIRNAIPYGDGIISWKQFMRYAEGQRCVSAPVAPGDTAAITYTGGTTGTPKGVEITNLGLNSVAFSLIHAGIAHKKGDVFLDIIPVFTSYGIAVGMHTALCARLKNVLIPKFAPENLPKLIKRYRPQIMIGVPAFYEILTRSPEMKGLDMSFATMYISGGDTMNLSLERRLNEWFKGSGSLYPFSQGYGMSEVTSVAAFSLYDISREGSSGIPLLAATVSIFEPGTMNELPFGEEGEVCISGPTLMARYFRKPDETENVLRTHPDGTVWVHSGDIGWMDEDGFLYIVGRIKHIIVRFDGHKIFPIQIENMVTRHEKVAECAVISIPDLDHGFGDYPLVLAVPSKAAANMDRAALRDELMAYCNEKLEERGRPADIVFIDEMPLNSMGKVDHMRLKEQFGDHDYRTAQK